MHCADSWSFIKQTPSGLNGWYSIPQMG